MEIPLDGSVLKLIRIQGTATVTHGRPRPLPDRGAAADRHDLRDVRGPARRRLGGRACACPPSPGDALLRTENARGLSLDSLSLTATSIPIGMLEVRALTLGFDPAAGSWTGTAKLKLPGPPPQVIADATVVVRDGRVRAREPGRRQLARHVRLRRAAGAARARRAHRPVPVRRRDGARRGPVAARPRPARARERGRRLHRRHAGGAAAARAHRRSARPPASASYTASSTGRQEFAGDLALQVQPDLGVSAGVKGVVQPTWFVVQGQARVRVIGLDLQGDGLFSNVGVAGVRAGEAAELGQGRAAVPRRLRLPVRDQARRPDVAASCDVAPWSPVALGDKAGPSARAAQAAVAAVRRALRASRAWCSRSPAPTRRRACTLTGPAGTGDAARPARRGQRGTHLPRRGRAARRALAAARSSPARPP